MASQQVKRLFQLTKREYFADFFITPPLTAFLLYVSLRDGVSPTWGALFASGFFAWTLYEYALHRWGLHGLRGLKAVHQLHHDDQRDYIAIHPVATLVIYGAFWLALGLKSSAFSVGFSVGYIAYATLHTMFHFRRLPKLHWLFYAHRRHALHHRFNNLNYGVTTSLWDKLFGTEL